MRTPMTRVRASALRSALKDVIGIVEGRSTIPVLECVVLQVVDGRISVTATDLDVQAIRTLASDDRDGPDSADWLGSIKPFSVALPAKPLIGVLGELDGDAMVMIKAPAEWNETWAGRVTLRAGRARFALNALPVADFPILQAFEVDASFEMPASQLADALAAVDHAISTEETRYYLNGVYVHPHELAFRFVTTDGHRLARQEIDGPDGAASFPAAIVARKTVRELEKLLAAAIKTADEHGAPPVVAIEATADGKRMRFAMDAGDGGSVELIAKSIDGDFPDYARVIPASPEQRAVIKRADLSAAVKRVAVLANDKSRIVKAEFGSDLGSGTLTLTSASPELGEAVEQVPCSYAGPDMTIGFDARYWRDVLNAGASDDVAMEFTDEQGPVRVTGWADNAATGALVQVLMPCRV